MNIKNVNSFVTRDELFSAISRSSYPSVITTYDSINPTILFANKEHENLTGFKSDYLIGKNPRIFQGKLTIRSTIDSLKRELNDFDSWEGTMINYTKSGKPYKVFIVIFGTSVDNGERFYIAVKHEQI